MSDPTGSQRNRDYVDRRQQDGERQITIWVAEDDVAHFKALARESIKAQRLRSVAAAKLLMAQVYGDPSPKGQMDLMACIQAAATKKESS